MKSNFIYQTLQKLSVNDLNQKPHTSYISLTRSAPFHHPDEGDEEVLEDARDRGENG